MKGRITTVGQGRSLWGKLEALGTDSDCQRTGRDGDIKDEEDITEA